MHTQSLGYIYSQTGTRTTINVPVYLLTLGGSAVGTYVGFQIGGPMGAAVGALVGAFVGALASGIIKKFRVIIKGNGEVVVEYETK